MLALRTLRLGEPDTHGLARFCRRQRVESHAGLGGARGKDGTRREPLSPPSLPDLYSFPSDRPNRALSSIQSEIQL